MNHHATPQLTLSRRTVLRLLVSGAGAAILAGCGSQQAATSSPPTTANGSSASAAAPASSAASQPPAQPSASVSANASGQPRTGGTLRVAVPADISTLDGHLRLTQAYDSLWQVFDRLTAFDENLKPQPQLAESWDINPTFTQIKLNLRKGVLWHSGREFTSDDVKYNLNRAKDPKLAQVGAAWFTQVDTPEKYTVVLTSDQPRPLVFDFFEFFNMIDKVTTEGPDAKTKVVGTGPFSFVEWVQGDHQTYSKNKNYWQTGRPYLDGFQAFVRAETASTPQIEARALDLSRITAPADIVRLKADPKYQVIPLPNSGGDLELGYNASQKPFDNKLLRQAFNFATNRQRLVDLYQGQTEAIDLPWDKSSPAYDAAKNKAYAFDLGKAKSLMQQAGVSSLETEVLVQAGLPILEDFMQAVQQDLATLNVKLTITRQESGLFFANLLAKKYALFASTNGGFNISPGFTMNLSNPWKGNFGYSNPRWTELQNSLATETDPTKLKALYGTVNDFILDECWEQPVALSPLVYLATSAVHGLKPNMHTSVLYNDVWLDA